MTGIYLITNMVNGKRYVGQSINIQKRFWDHTRPGAYTPVGREIREYGVQNFRFETLEQCDPDELYAREIHWIDVLSPEYNINHGSINLNGVPCFPPRVRKKISASVKRHWESLPEEKKQHICKHQLIGPLKGHPVSEETRQKLREANTGKTQSVETIARRKETWRAKVATGWTKSGAGHFKPVRCVETGVTYKSVKDAAVAIGSKPSNISGVLKGRLNTCQGLHFEYCGVETIRDECSEVGLR